MKEPTLDTGFYVGIVQHTRNYMFKCKSSLKLLTPLELLQRQMNEQRSDSQETKTRVKGFGSEQSTIHSGWFPIEDPQGTQSTNKARVADKLLEQFTDDVGSVERATSKVIDFKRSVKDILNRVYEDDGRLQTSHIDEMNRKSCVVQEIQVWFLYVSKNKEHKNAVYSKDTNLWYYRFKVRKFFFENQLCLSAMQTLAEEISKSEHDFSVGSDLVVRKTNKGPNSKFVVANEALLTLEDTAVQNLIKNLRLKEAERQKMIAERTPPRKD